MVLHHRTKNWKIWIRLYKKVKKIYSSDKQLPIIFVYTRSQNEEFVEGIKKEIIKELNEPNIKYIDIISQEMTVKVSKKKLR